MWHFHPVKTCRVFAQGVVAALLLERASAPVLGAPALRRVNYRGHELATAGGIVIVLAVLVVEGARTALAEFGVGEELSDSLLRSMVLFACFAFAFLGLIDDLLGTEADRGFRGHLHALAHGRLTTGAMKLFGGGVVANARLRAVAQERADAAGVTLRIPPFSLCTDNGAMIAAVGARLIAAGHAPSEPDFGADSTLPVTTVQA